MRTVVFNDREFGLGNLGPSMPDIRDKRFPRAALTQAADEGIESHGFIGSTLLHDQGAQSSCVGQSAGKLMEIKATVKWLNENRDSDEDIPIYNLSRSWPYLLGREAIGVTHFDAGCFMRDVIKGLAREGIPSEAVCEYDENELLTQRPDDAVAQAAHHKIAAYYSLRRVLEVKAALHLKHPVSYAQAVYENYTETTGRQGYFPRPAGRLISAHQTTIVGWDDLRNFKGWSTPGGFLTENSWGHDHGIDNPFTTEFTGPGGHYWLPYEALLVPDLLWDIWTVHDIPLVP
jgi:hypothetical protein